MIPCGVLILAPSCARREPPECRSRASRRGADEDSRIGWGRTLSCTFRMTCRASRCVRVCVCVRAGSVWVGYLLMRGLRSVVSCGSLAVCAVVRFPSSARTRSRRATGLSMPPEKGADDVAIRARLCVLHMLGVAERPPPCTHVHDNQHGHGHLAWRSHVSCVAVVVWASRVSCVVAVRA